MPRDDPDGAPRPTPGEVRVADLDGLDDPGDAAGAWPGIRSATFDDDVPPDDDIRSGEDRTAAGDRATTEDRAAARGSYTAGGRPTAEDGPDRPAGPGPVRVADLDADSPPDADGTPRAVAFDGRPSGRGPGVRDRRRARRPALPETPPHGDEPGGTGAEPPDAVRGGARGRRGSTTDTDGRGPARERRRGGGSGSAGARPDVGQDDESRAREICLRLLTDRARTVKELADALRRKEIPDDVAARVLERLDQVGLVDDEAFAGQWVRSRHRHKGLGRRALAVELHRKGVAKEIADEALTEIDADSEAGRARELVDRRLRSMPVGTKDERLSAARRLVGVLARKGYGPGIAYSVVREAIAARGAEDDELGETPPED